MFKLFRRIRHKLINEGNLKRYLIYAIGEILLVMIGILLALQVNNWNQKRVNNKKEIKALTDLSKEFKLNKERIKIKQDSRISIVPELDNYIQLVSAGKADYNSFKDFHSNQFMFGMTNLSNGVIDALISSGDISLISNDSLKYFLADWKNQAENLYENEEILWQSGLAYIASSSNKIPHPSHNWSDWNQKKLELAFKDIVSNTAYRNNLTGFEGTNKIVIGECNAILSILEKVLAFLDDEISKNK